MAESFFTSPISVTTQFDGDHFIVSFNNFEDIIIRPFDFNLDIDLLTEWANQDRAIYWGMKGLSKQEIISIYESVEQDPYDNAYIGELSSQPQPLFLFHNYVSDKSFLTEYYDLAPGDRGTHKIFSPAKQAIPNLTWYIFRAINEFIFSNPDVQRIIDEPDIENEKYFIACKQAGYELGKVIHLPDKIAQLTILTRQNFERLQQLPPRRKQKMLMRPLWVWFRVLPARIKEKVQTILNLQ